MKRIQTVLVFLVACVVAIAATSTKKKDRADGSLPNVSLISLLATPEKYEGKRIRVHGIVALAYEVQVLFPSADLSLTNANGFWLDDDFSEPLRDFDAWKKKSGDKSEATWYEVRLEATFTSTEKGHLGMCAGGFKDISRFDWIRRVKEPNQTPEPTTMAVTPPAAQESRQP